MTAGEPLLPHARSKLLAAASAASAATVDLVEVVRGGEISRSDNVGSGEALETVLSAALLIMDATVMKPGDGQLYGAITKWIEDHGSGTTRPATSDG